MFLLITRRPIVRRIGGSDEKSNVKSGVIGGYVTYYVRLGRG